MNSIIVCMLRLNLKLAGFYIHRCTNFYVHECVYMRLYVYSVYDCANAVAVSKE